MNQFLFYKFFYFNLFDSIVSFCFVWRNNMYALGITKKDKVNWSMHRKYFKFLVQFRHGFQIQFKYQHNCFLSMEFYIANECWNVILLLGEHSFVDRYFEWMLSARNISKFKSKIYYNVAQQIDCVCQVKNFFCKIYSKSFIRKIYETFRWPGKVEGNFIFD